VFESVSEQELVIAAGSFAVISLLCWGYWQYLTHDRRQRDARSLEKLRTWLDRSYEEARQGYKDARARLEKRNRKNTIVIDLIHDLGDEFEGRDSAEQEITFDEAFNAIAAIRGANARTNIMIILHTLGGYARPAHMVALALKKHLKKVGRHNPYKHPKVTVYVPYVAMSGGTFIALAADRIFMDETASLGPIDTIYGSFPSEAYEDLIAQKGVEQTQDLLVLLAHEASKYDKYAQEVAREIINPVHKLPLGKMPADGPRTDAARSRALADHLTSGEMSHSQAISPTSARELGINLSRSIPPDVYNLVDARIRMIQTKAKSEADKEAREADEKKPDTPNSSGDDDQPPTAGRPDRTDPIIQKVIDKTLEGIE